MIEISTELLSMLFILAIIIGIVDAIGGGGGLITLPILMWIGLPPLQALGTSKFQLLFASLSATIYFVKNTKLLDYRRLWPILLVTIIAASLGAKAIHLFSADWLLFLIPIVLII
ncbi:MAG: TSUP family transporter, partial [Rhizobiales bacterium]|nr:TSUP family transporter [Hyphomicrobiales bacterium]